MERFVIEKTDYTIFVSSYIYNYLVGCGYEIDIAKYQILRYPSHAFDNKKIDNQVKSKPIGGIAFFGRQELRKGFSIIH